MDGINRSKESIPLTSALILHLLDSKPTLRQTGVRHNSLLF